MLNKRVRGALDLPSKAFERAFNRRWEYEQADTSAAWDREDFEALSLAITEHYNAPGGKAFARLLELAAAGSVIAMVVVGEGYYWGTGTAADPVEAENWLRQAYERGSRRGLLSYGRVAYRRNDLPAAERIFRKGADAGWSEAQYRLADVMYRQAPGKYSAELWALIKSAAAAGHPLARLWYAKAMVRGRFGLWSVPKGFREWWICLKEIQQAWDARASQPLAPG